MFDFLTYLLTIGGIYAIMALGLNIQAGYGGLLNFGHIAFAGIGAYATGIAHARGWPVPAGMALGMALATALGWCIGRLGRRLAADYWGIATLAVAEILRTVALNEDWLTGGANGISAIPGLFENQPRPWNELLFMALVLGLVALLAWLSARLGDGRFGRAIRLMREQPQLAACMGYDLQSLKTRTVMSGAAVTALAGSLYALQMNFAGPEFLLAAETFVLWTMLMVGGIGRTAGVLLGVVLLQAVHAFVPFAKDMLGFDSDRAGALRLGMIGLILLACLLLRREGLLPEKLRASA
ncbi:branched-chain amino acid ABC transporter permease [Verminephrobacter eiseniae]|uniref:Inner-membrane translocator n=1 Tax=Verminephrobacter eiseniae (strain EF01-2) TaxID=391735 RepID=A1WRB3_VEREI|nr:branched-chain amino acid ABC transporter permease [Verminephrobacter eiseniae]ABM60170.1 inner-membrane translocator [Verminephrobacter eiseniae EF01-2]MCW5260402.1 branched-chain amino acid ABC transporter permease [Verminephrobacter eiseniae]MCW5285660.1 branched-chain amino acid ABC transporter permease [Verminephrobacter eiseniae]MCW5303960.1 branched-chain amino acid ABC transporter permease [Verminephrobacter eiseniae]MCW8180965.1 branched-chain amino acid ABC transporter permease [V